MAQSFPETAHNKTDKKKFNENFDQIDWGDLKDRPIEKRPESKKHKTAGLCGEFGMSVFDEKKYKENFDQIDWSGVERFTTGEKKQWPEGGEPVITGTLEVTQVDTKNKTITFKSVE